MINTYGINYISSTLKKIEAKKFISNENYRADDGSVGQVLEREFQVEENNLHKADLYIPNDILPQ